MLQPWLSDERKTRLISADKLTDQDRPAMLRCRKIGRGLAWKGAPNDDPETIKASQPAILRNNIRDPVLKLNCGTTSECRPLLQLSASSARHSSSMLAWPWALEPCLATLTGELPLEAQSHWLCIVCAHLLICRYGIHVPGSKLVFFCRASTSILLPFSGLHRGFHAPACCSFGCRFQTVAHHLLCCFFCRYQSRGKTPGTSSTIAPSSRTARRTSRRARCNHLCRPLFPQHRANVFLLVLSCLWEEGRLPFTFNMATLAFTEAVWTLWHCQDLSLLPIGLDPATDPNTLPSYRPKMESDAPAELSKTELDIADLGWPLICRLLYKVLVLSLTLLTRIEAKHFSPASRPAQHRQSCRKPLHLLEL